MTKKLITAMIIIAATLTVSFAATKAMDIVAQMKPEIKVSLDGKTLDLKSPDGQKVNVVVYNGTTYLPVRALSEALGLQVGWDQATETVTLKRGANTQEAGTNTQEAGTNTNAGNQDGTNHTNTGSNGNSEPNSSAKTNIGDIVYQDDKIEIKYMGTDTDDEDEEVKFVVKNLTKEKYRLTAFDVKCNTRTLGSKLHDDEDIEGFETEDVEIEFSKSELKKTGITKLETLEFKLKLNHVTNPFETTTIKINF